MLFTYKDKGPTTTFVYSSNQRPMTKYDSITNIPGKPNPIKHWRKQLAPSVSQNVIQSHPTLQTLDNSVKTDITTSESDLCKSYIDILNINSGCIGVSGSNPCVTGSFKINRSANTIINKDFCWNSKQYLQSRCKTYEQNQTLGQKTGTEYEYFGASCNSKSDGTVCKPIIHKPNNSQFKQQGGVSSSSRIAKLKYETIKNSTNKYDSLLANLDSSSHILNRKPVPCRGWRIRGKRPYSAEACGQSSSIDKM
jgi:hypothetical protein